MFTLMDYHSFSKRVKAKELMYFYVEENFRGLGIGKKLLRLVKEETLRRGSDLLVLDTLNTELNSFYKKAGSVEICEGQLLGHPTTLLAINLNS